MEIKKKEEISEKVLDAIIEKYGTQKAFAQVLGTTEGNLSKRIKNPSYKFIKELEHHGLVIHDNSSKNIIHNNGTNRNVDQYSGLIYNLIEKVAKLEHRVEELEKRK